MARRLTQAAAEAEVATQMGNQHHNSIRYRLLVHYIREGAIGKVKEAHAWSNRPIWPQGIKRPEGSDPVPDGFHWDLWLGVAPERPYKKDVYHPFKWRGWYDFGAGALGDMGCHIIDPVVWALDLGPALSVRYEGPEAMPETFPKEEILTYRFKGTTYTAGNEVTMKWYDGGRKPPEDLVTLPKGMKGLPKQGTLFIGTKGAVVTPHPGGGPMLLPREQYADYEKPKLQSINHSGQWIDAIRGKGETTSSFAYAGPMTETVLMGVVASRVPGQTLEWDAAALKFTGSAKATAYVKEDYRRGWEVAGLS
ncbi:MAG: gfo/Idh/MocA family oxidoreductase [Phycisphaerae bacterium]